MSCWRLRQKSGVKESAVSSCHPGVGGQIDGEEIEIAVEKVHLLFQNLGRDSSLFWEATVDVQTWVDLVISFSLFWAIVLMGRDCSLEIVSYREDYVVLDQKNVIGV